MQINYQYASPSMCLQYKDHIKLGLSPDLSRDEKVSFVGRLKHPLIFRDAMLMLREIVISDMRVTKKDYSDFFAWYNQEIESRLLHKEGFLKVRRKELQEEIDKLKPQLESLTNSISDVQSDIFKLKTDINSFGNWKNYDTLERKFWEYILNRDHDLWYILDPVITVHPDQVSFEAFSSDESTYGCLSINMEEFQIEGTPKLGTTNIDFSVKLAREMERFRTYNEVELSINPEGFTIDTGITPEHIEKKIDLPESWIKGFNQVSAAASLKGFEIELSPLDLYDICSFLRRNKAHSSPRAMRWVFEPDKYVKVIFEPWEKELELSTIYTGDKKHTERMWGRRRWLIVEKIIPHAKSFILRLFGFGMPQFIIADLGIMSMTIGFTSWSSNDWVKGTSFNIMAGLIGQGNDQVKKLLKINRIMTFEDIKETLPVLSDEKIRSGIGTLLRKGDAYYDPIIEAYRFRQLLNVPLPLELYQTTQLEREVLSELSSKPNVKLILNNKKEIEAESAFSISVRSRYGSQTKTTTTKIIFDQDKQIVKVDCGCRIFKKGPRNISAPCKHILALYIAVSKYLDLQIVPETNYNLETLEVLRKKNE
ncbi:MAG: SWIM zinc finger family protein [Promethearchaeota archaeon]